MYRLEESEFGGFTKYRFYNKETGNGFSIVPEHGGTMLELWLHHKQILDACETAEALSNNQSYKSSLLFPFPNRLKDGTFQLNGNSYQFPINDAGTNNALHGISRDVKMDVLHKECSEEKASITLSYFETGEHKSYPFAFLVEAVFSISEETGFELEMKVTNEDNQSIPIGIGWHPYFKLEGQVNDLSLQLPACKLIEVDERMIPTGNLLKYTYFQKERRIGKTVLDNGFELNENPGKQKVLLSHPDYQLKYWQETGPEKFNFLQVYTPSHRSSIAIEPMTCNIDALNNRDGLILLKPEASIQASCGVTKVKGEKEI